MIATVPAIRRSSSEPYASKSEPNVSVVTNPVSAAGGRCQSEGLLGLLRGGDHRAHERHSGGLRGERRVEDLDRPAAVEPLHDCLTGRETGCERGIRGLDALDRVCADLLAEQLV